MPRLTLRFFGSFQADLNGAPLSQLRSTRIQALLAYLAVEAQRAHTRETLAALFWPDEAEAVAKQNLRQALYQLRQLLGEAVDSSSEPSFLLLTRATVQFNPNADSTLDVALFLAHLARQEFKQASELYSGELLAGLSSGSPLFEEWLVVTRERLHIEAMDALDRLTQQSLREGDFRQAQSYARRQLALEPWRESAHRQLMMTLARGGARSAALAQYEACRRILAEELGVEPDDETKRLAEQIRTGRVEKGLRVEEGGEVDRPAQSQASEERRSEQKDEGAPATTIEWGEAPDIATLYGRADELAMLESWIMVDRCRLVILLGMGGIGKTALTAGLARQVARHFESVIWRSLLNAPPLNEILEGWLDLLTDVRPGDIADSLDAKLNLLFRHLRTHRCLLVLDNAESIMQGGERVGLYRPGCEEYGQLFKRMGEISHQSVLLVTSREQPQEVARLRRETPLVRTLALEGLGSESGTAILRQQGLIDPTTQVGSLIQRYSGNPLALMLVAETIQELYAGDLTAFLEGETPIFDDIRDVLDQQFARLSHLERNILLWLAIEREPITVQQLSDNFQNLITKHALVEALNSLRRRSLLERTTSNTLGETPAGADFTLQNVVTEYLTEHLIKSVCLEIEQGTPLLLKSHALSKAQAKEYVRQSQARLILQPIAEYLGRRLGARGFEAAVRSLLNVLRQENDRLATYAGGNLLYLLLYAGADLRAMDFSGLAIWQGYLQGESLPALNLTESDLSGCVFTDTFGAISSVGISPTGTLIAGGATNGQIRLWRGVDGQSCGVFEGHTNYVFSVLFSSNGRVLYSGSDDQTICVWDVQSLLESRASHGQALQTVREHSRGVWRLALSQDGRLLASASGDRTIVLWAVEETAGTLQYLYTLHGHDQGVRSVAFDPNTRLLASGCIDGVIHLWDLQKRVLIARLIGHSKVVWSLAFSPDSHLLASSSDDGTVMLWNLPNLSTYQEPKAGPRDIQGYETARTLSGHSGPVPTLAFRHDGKVLASGSTDQTVRLWDVERGVAFQILHGHHDEVTGVAFDPTGGILASSSMDRTVRLWESQHGQALRTLQGHMQGVMAIAFSPAANLLATACQDSLVRLWNWQSGELLMTLRGHVKEVHGVAFSPDGNTLASSSIDQTIRLWDVQSGSLRSVLRGHQRWVRAVVFSPDGALIASCCNDSTVRLWDAYSGELLRTIEHAESVWAVRFSPDGQTLASTGTGRVIRLWNLQSGINYMSLHGHTNWVTSLAYTCDGALLASGSGDQTVRLWDAASGELYHVLQGHRAWIYSVAFSSDGNWLASGSADRSINLWNRKNGERVQSLRGHTNEVRSAAFSPDGGTLASGSIDETVRLWQLPAGGALQSLRAPRPYEMMKIHGVTGITEAQRAALRALGAVG